MIEQSSGLFIFAATVANFIQDRTASNPRRQLKIMLTTAYVASSATSPHRHLDALYLTVLREAFPKIGEDDWQRANLRVVLGSIVLLFDPLDPECLDVLLELDESTSRSTLQQLHSIAIVPNAGDGPVRLIHPSEHDFLIDGVRCGDVNFVVDARTRMRSLLSGVCEHCRAVPGYMQDR